MHPLCFRGVHFLWGILVIMDYFHYTYKHNHIDFNSDIYKVSTYHYNWHSGVEILILLKGRIDMSCNSEVFTMEPLDTIIISPQVRSFSNTLILTLVCINLYCAQIKVIGIINSLRPYVIMQHK